MWFWETLLGGLRKPLDALFGAEQRVFLPFLVTSAVLAAIVWALSVRRTSLLSYLFSRDYWLHRSSLLDAQVIIVRGLLGAFLLVPTFLSTMGVAVFVNHEASPDDLLKWADMAMYESKESGRNTVRYHAWRGTGD